MRALVAESSKSTLSVRDIELGDLNPDQVEIAVETCGICHSDLSMLRNEWGMTTYPFVGGHEVVGTISRFGSQVKQLKVGDRVGLGWHAGSCQHCYQCSSGNQNLCPKNEGTIVGRPGGFATHVKAQAQWVIPLPGNMNPDAVGPLFCGGATVFNPLIQFGVRPTDRVGVIGIGGLGHMAVKFLRAWGCEVTAFTSTDSKHDEARAMGAHRVVTTSNQRNLNALQGHFDFILSTVNVALPWDLFINMLAPKGRLHSVGAVPEPISASAFALIVGQRSISGSPVGSPSLMMKMLEFCARHAIEPTVEYFPMSEANAALQHLESGKARYRIVLKNDLA